MSGYIQRDRPPAPTRQQWIAMALAIIAGGFMLFVALYASKVVSGWVGVIGRIPVGGPLMFILGSNFLVQRWEATDPLTTFLSRHRKLIAGFFYLLGISISASPFVLGGDQ